MRLSEGVLLVGRSAALGRRKCCHRTEIPVGMVVFCRSGWED